MLAFVAGHSDDFNPFDDDFLEHALSASGALGYSTKGDSGGGGGPGSAVSAADGTAPPADSSVDDVSIEEDFEVCSRVSPASVYYSPDIDYTRSAVEGGVIFIKKKLYFVFAFRNVGNQAFLREAQVRLNDGSAPPGNTGPEPLIPTTGALGLVASGSSSSSLA